LISLTRFSDRRPETQGVGGAGQRSSLGTQVQEGWEEEGEGGRKRSLLFQATHGASITTIGFARKALCDETGARSAFLKAKLSSTINSSGLLTIAGRKRKGRGGKREKESQRWEKCTRDCNSS